MANFNPVPLTTDPTDPASPKGAIPVTISGTTGGGGAVDSVNAKTGAVVLEADDLFTSDGQNVGAILSDLQSTVLSLVGRVEDLENA